MHPLKRNCNRRFRNAAVLLFCLQQTACVNDAEELLFRPQNLLIGAFAPRIYFTKPYPSVEPGKYDALNAVLDILNRSQKRIDIFCYSFSEENLIKALISARQRNVAVSITGSEETDYSRLTAAGFHPEIRIRSGLQHAKVIIADDSVLISGTGNFTKSGFFHNSNAYFILPVSEKTAKEIRYSLSHERDAYDSIRLPFSGRIGFSPNAGKIIQARIVRHILDAKFSIRFMMFSHTDPVISHALSHAAARGVFVEGIYDGSPAASSQAAKLASSHPFNPMIYSDGNDYSYTDERGLEHGGHLHHKTVIIDGHRVLTGSYNWSMSARDSNLESYFEFENPLTASFFQEEFDENLYRSNYLMPTVSAGGSVRLTYDSASDSFCTDGPADSFTVFSGRDLFFRAEYFQNISEAACVKRNAKHRASAGIPDVGSHYLMPDAENGVVLSHNINFRRSGTKKRKSLPCENAGQCMGAKILRAGKLWIMTEPDVEYRSYRKWDAAGLQDERELIFAEPGLFLMEENLSDAVLFLKDPKGLTYIACLQSGKALSAPVSYFIQNAKWEKISIPACIEIE